MGERAGRTVVATTLCEERRAEKRRYKRLIFAHAAMLIAAICMLLCALPKSAYAVTRPEIEQHLRSLINKYQESYWTSTGSACPSTPGNHTKSNGTCKSLEYYGSQCKGFASWVFNELFETGPIGSYSGDYSYIPSPNGATAIYTTVAGTLYTNDEDAVKEAFFRSAPGDFVQMRRRGKSWGHSQIVVDVDDEGVTLFDCNADGHCKVQVYSQSWTTFCAKNSGFSIYRADNYDPSDVTPAPSPTPDVNHNPYGDLTVVEGSVGKIHVVGWVADPDDPNAHPYVDIYVGGPAGPGVEGHRIQANLDSVIDGAHTYDAWLNVSCSGNQPIYAYGINVGEGDNTELWNCPKYVNITADTEPPSITNVQVSNLTPDGYDVSCDVSDNLGVSVVRFPTWTSHSSNGNTQDDITWHEQSHGNGRYTYHVNVNDHGSERGVHYHTHIYACDAAGNSTSVGPSVNIPVPHVMVNYNGNTYLRMDAGPADYHSWGEAQQWCEGAYFSGHLATITSADEQRVISQLIDGGNIHYWIGASDADGEGSWQWVTGEEFSYSNWRSDEPNGGTSENYAGISSADGHWVDLNGNANGYNGYIMELDKFHNLYGEIVTDVEEGVYIINSFHHPEFAVDVTGMSGDAHANVELWADNGSDAQRFQFTKNYVETADGPIFDGSYTITNVHSGMALDVENASLASGANVQQYPVNGTNAQKWYIERGPDGSVYLRSKVCDFYMDVYGANYESGTNIQTWFANDGAAQRFVLKRSANPKAISSKVYDITPDGYKVQVELDAPRGIKFVEFPTWSDGNNRSDITWGHGEVNGNTVTYEVKVSDHNNRHGLYWTHVYVTDDYGNRCWVDAEQNDVLVPEKIASVGSKSYFLVPADMSWDDAKRACVKYGDLIGFDAHLATIKSAEEQELVTSLVSGGERVEYWIGASDADSEGAWTWVDGSSLEGYSSWLEGEPNGGTGENYAVAFASTGLWNDEYADAYNTKGVGFIAEVEGNDRCAPTISDIRVSDLDETGYTVTCTVSDSSGVSKVEFPTWVPERGEGGNDAVWKEGELYENPETGDVIAEFRVSTLDHGGARGEYKTHIYATDKLGNKTRIYTVEDTNGKIENVLVPDAVYSTAHGTYYRFDREGTWTDAKACVEAMPVDNMKLAMVSNEADDDALASLLAGADKSAYWLGLSDAEGTGTITWDGGDAVTYSHWASGQPGTYTGPRYGATLVSNGKWYCYANMGVNLNPSLMGFVAMVQDAEALLCVSGHTWGEWETTIEPTCAKVGYRERHCSVCGEYEVEQLAKLAHDPMEARRENEVAATCEKDGSYESVVVCDRCGEEISRETVQVGKLGHSPAEPVEDNRRESTCTVEGSYESVVYCSRCGKELSREGKTLAKAAHDPAEPVEENRTESTCAQEGHYDLVAHCKVCGAETSRETVTIPKKEHAWDDGVATVPPTCTQPGERTYTCVACHQTRAEVVGAKGHTPGKPVAENASESNTCIVGGTYDEVVYCETCHEELSRTQKTQPAGQHVPVTDVAVAPTCTKEGLTEGSHCQVCGSTIVAQERIAATGHVEEHVDAVPPTCTESGATAGVKCKTCGEVVSGCEPIGDLGHDYKDNVVAPTCSQFGYTEHRCARCGDSSITDRVPSKAHAASEPEVESEVPATCEAQGSKVMLTRCKDCGKELYRTSSVTPAAGHKAGDSVVEEVAATCEKAGSRVTVVRCTACDHEISRSSEVIPATGHKAGNPTVESEVAPTCERPGSRTLVTHCVGCGKEMRSETAPVPALGHAWDAGSVAKEATCNDLGVRLFTCGTCGAHRSESIPSGNHRSGNPERENEDPATCTKAGHYESVIRCSECGVELSRQTVSTPVAEHEWGEWEVVRDATTAREGLEMRTCKNCRLSDTRAIDKLELQDLSGAEVVVDTSRRTYNGSAFRPAVTSVTLDDKALVAGTDFVVSYGANVDVGTGKVTVTGKGAYTGAVERTFEIAAADIARAGVSAVADQTYTGSAITPKPKVTLGGRTLVEGADYALSYRNNVKVGTAAVVVAGKGNYTGSKSVNFTIVRAFPDVPAGAWYAGVVSRAVGLGLLSGYANGNFGPDDRITRGQVAVVLWNMADGPAAGAGARTFPDVGSGAYYYNAVRWASGKGVVSGYANGRFGPNDNVTREQLAAMLANYAKSVAGRQATGSAADYASMSDGGKVSPWAVPSVGWCFRSGILSGSGGNVNPKGNATRAEAAKMVVVLHDLLA